MPEHARFNPRYSPEFQRGYVPEAHPAAAERADAAPARAPGPPHTAPAPAPPVEATQAIEGTEEAVEVAVPAPQAPSEAAEEAGGGDSPASAARSRSPVWRNPYIIVLLVLGVLMIANGVQLYFRSIGSMYTPRESYEPHDLVTLQVLWGVAPVLMTAGIFVLIGVGFFAASRWRPRPPEDRAVQRSPDGRGRAR